MELLLLLSAFLTALTGAITGARPVQAAAQEQVVTGERVATVLVRVLPSRPVQAWPTMALVSQTVDRPLTIASHLPVYGQRRRE